MLFPSKLDLKFSATFSCHFDWLWVDHNFLRFASRLFSLLFGGLIFFWRVWIFVRFSLVDNLHCEADDSFSFIWIYHINYNFSWITLDLFIWNWCFFIFFSFWIFFFSLNWRGEFKDILIRDIFWDSLSILALS